VNLFKFGAYTNDPPSYFNRDAEKQDRLLGYKRAWEAYLAELPDPIINDNPDINDNVKVNPARALINTSVYFLFGTEITFEDSPELAQDFSDSTEGDDPTAALPDWLQDLNKVWKANRKQSLLYNIGLSGALHGDVFVKIVPNGAGVMNEFPRLLLLDPATVDVVWDPNDCTKITKFIIEYTTEDDNGKPYIRTQEITANMDASTEVIQDWSMQWYEQEMEWVINVGWMPETGGRVKVGPAELWPYPWAPILHNQNIELPHMFWGLPDLDDSSVELLKALQRSMSSVNKVVRVHGSPRMFLKGVMPDQNDEIDVSADNIITVPNINAELSVLQTLQDVKAVPTCTR